MRIVYGPVPSWRLGRSLGIDPVCRMEKTCPFDCVYCQLGRTKAKTTLRRRYIALGTMKAELDAAPKRNVDTITFSGTGEPTLNSQIGEMISYARRFGIPVAVLTNSALLPNPRVRKALLQADIVAAKLDAPDEATFQEVNRPVPGLRLATITAAIRKFRNGFKGRLALQMMFVPRNKGCAREMAELARELAPDEVQLDTPLRRSAVPPLSPVEMAEVERHFRGLHVVQVYRRRKPETVPLDLHETRMRRP